MNGTENASCHYILSHARWMARWRHLPPLMYCNGHGNTQHWFKTIVPERGGYFFLLCEENSFSFKPAETQTEPPGISFSKSSHWLKCFFFLTPMGSKSLRSLPNLLWAPTFSVANESSCSVLGSACHWNSNSKSFFFFFSFFCLPARVAVPVQSTDNDWLAFAHSAFWIHRTFKNALWATYFTKVRFNWHSRSGAQQ